MKSGQFEGRKLLVIGGTSGIGLETARIVAEQGGAVVVVGNRPEKAETARQELAGIMRREQGLLAHSRPVVVRQCSTLDAGDRERARRCRYARQLSWNLLSRALSRALHGRLRRVSQYQPVRLLYYPEGCGLARGAKEAWFDREHHRDGGETGHRNGAGCRHIQWPRLGWRP